MDRAPLAQLRCVVTGASSGIGHGIARAFGDAGAAVLVHYHAHAEPAEQLVAEMRAQGATAHAVQAHLGHPEDCERLMREAARLLGGIDVLVANAGIQRDAAFTELALEHWHEVLDLNLTGQFLCAQHAVRAFRRQGMDAQRSRRIGEPEDVARAAVWLASDDSDHVVGTTLFVDGAMTLDPAFREGG